MDFVEARLEDHDLAIQRHVAGKGLPVDIVAQRFGNLRSFAKLTLVQALGKVCGAAILARIVLEGGARLGEVAAEMAEQFAAKRAMLADEYGKLAHGLEGRVLRKARAAVAFVMSGSRPVLPPARPLRTVLASFPAHGSSKSLFCRAAAVGMDKSEVPVGAILPVPIAMRHADGFAVVEALAAGRAFVPLLLRDLLPAAR